MGIDQVSESVGRYFKVNLGSIVISQRGRVDENIPRWLLMYFAQEIAGYLGLKRTGSIPTTI